MERWNEVFFRKENDLVLGWGLWIGFKFNFVFFEGYFIVFFYISKRFFLKI